MASTQAFFSDSSPLVRLFLVLSISTEARDYVYGVRDLSFSSLLHLVSVEENDKSRTR